MPALAIPTVQQLADQDTQALTVVPDLQEAYLIARGLKGIDGEVCIGCSLLEYNLLYWLAAAIRPSEILEIGPGWGMSAWAMLLGCPKAKVTQVDIRAGYSTRLIPEYLRSQTQLTVSKSTDFFDKNTQKFDLCLVDGEHMDPTVSSDLRSATKSLTSRGVVVAHDIFHPNLEHIQVSVRKAAEENGRQHVLKSTGFHGIGLIF